MRARERRWPSRACARDCDLVGGEYSCGFANATQPPVRCTYQRDEIVYAEGDPASSLFYIERGTVKKTRISAHGKERVVAICKVGEFLGAGCLGRLKRTLNAVAMTPCSVVRIEKSVMLRALSEQPTLAETFIAHLIDRNRHYEEDLIGHLFNPIEKRLARVLFVLSESCADEHERIVPKVSQETLAEMVGATRPRVNYFLNKFRQAGLIDCKKEIRLHRSFLEMVSREQVDARAVKSQLDPLSFAGDRKPLLRRMRGQAVCRVSR